VKCYEEGPENEALVQSSFFLPDDNYSPRLRSYYLLIFPLLQKKKRGFLLPRLSTVDYITTLDVLEKKRVARAAACQPESPHQLAR